MDLQATVMRVDERAVSAGEVLAAAFVAGRLDGVRQRIRDGLACKSLAREQSLEMSGDDLQHSLDAWRVSRDLISVEEFQRWLDSRDLEFDQLLGHLEREGLRHRLNRVVLSARERHAPEPGDVLALLTEEAELGGEAAGLAEEHALRLIAPRPEADESRREAIVRGLLAIHDLDSRDELETQLSVFELTPQVRGEVISTEVGYREFRHESLTDEALRGMLAECRSDLVRHELISTVAPSLDVGRELLCCVRLDGVSFVRATELAGLRWHVESHLTAELASLPFGHLVASAKPMDLFGPVAEDEGYLVAQLLVKEEPDLDQPETVRVLEEKVLDRLLRRQVVERARFVSARQAAQ